jgi:hypothetical protein
MEAKALPQNRSGTAFSQPRQAVAGGPVLCRLNNQRETNKIGKKEGKIAISAAGRPVPISLSVLLPAFAACRLRGVEGIAPSPLVFLVCLLRAAQRPSRRQESPFFLQPGRAQSLPLNIWQEF